MAADIVQRWSAAESPRTRSASLALPRAPPFPSPCPANRAAVNPGPAPAEQVRSAPSTGRQCHERRQRPYRRHRGPAAVRPAPIWPGAGASARNVAACTAARQHGTCTHLHPGCIVRCVSKKALLFPSIYEATRCEVINTRCDMSISESNAYLVFNRPQLAGADADRRPR